MSLPAHRSGSVRRWLAAVLRMVVAVMSFMSSHSRAGAYVLQPAFAADPACHHHWHVLHRRHSVQLPANLQDGARVGQACGANAWRAAAAAPDERREPRRPSLFSSASLRCALFALDLFGIKNSHHLHSSAFASAVHYPRERVCVCCLAVNAILLLSCPDCVRARHRALRVISLRFVSCMPRTVCVAIAGRDFALRLRVERLFEFDKLLNSAFHKFKLTDSQKSNDKEGPNKRRNERTRTHTCTHTDTCTFSRSTCTESSTRRRAGEHSSTKCIHNTRQGTREQTGRVQDTMRTRSRQPTIHVQRYALTAYGQQAN